MMKQLLMRNEDHAWRARQARVYLYVVPDLGSRAVPQPPNGEVFVGELDFQKKSLGILQSPKPQLFFFKSTSVQKTLLALIRIYTFKVKRFKAFFKTKSLKFNI